MCSVCVCYEINYYRKLNKIKSYCSILNNLYDNYFFQQSKNGKITASFELFANHLTALKIIKVLNHVYMLKAILYKIYR